MLINASKSALFVFTAAVSLGFSAPVAAAPQIGVTAALRGDVVRTASLETGAAIGQMSSGQSVYLGDDIKVGAQGRLQVMLLDETIFTLGANAVMRIDEFVYDPNDAGRSSLSTSIKQGAFRFVSGQIGLRVPTLRGHFLSLNGSYLESEHDNNYSQSYNPSEGGQAEDGTQREDETTGFGVSYTVLGASLHPTLANVFFTAISQNNETESNLTGFSTARHVTSFRVNYAYSF